MKEFTVLTINPGSSSTKMGVVKGDKVIVNREVDHHKEDFAECKTFADQEPVRMEMICKALEEEGIAKNIQLPQTESEKREPVPEEHIKLMSLPMNMQKMMLEVSVIRPALESL